MASTTSSSILASCPVTRTRPLAMAVVKGEMPGLNARTYGSSEVSATLNDSSASMSCVISMRPAPDTAKRGEAASSFMVSTSPMMLSSPLT